MNGLEKNLTNHKMVIVVQKTQETFQGTIFSPLMSVSEYKFSSKILVSFGIYNADVHG